MFIPGLCLDDGDREVRTVPENVIRPFLFAAPSLAADEYDSAVGEGSLLVDGVWAVIPSCGLQFGNDKPSTGIRLVHPDLIRPRHGQSASDRPSSRYAVKPSDRHVGLRRLVYTCQDSGANGAPGKRNPAAPPRYLYAHTGATSAFRSGATLSQVEGNEQFIDGHLVVLCYILENARQGLCPNLTMHRDHLVMLAVDLGRDTDVGSALPNRDVAETPKCPLQFGAADIAGQLHAAMISSRTKWSRITLGRSMVSSK